MVMKIRSFHTKVLLWVGPAQWQRPSTFSLSSQGIFFILEEGREPSDAEKESLRQCFQMSSFWRKEGTCCPGDILGCVRIKGILIQLDNLFFFFIFEPCHIYFLTQIVDALPIHRILNTVWKPNKWKKSPVAPQKQQRKRGGVPLESLLDYWRIC